MYRYRIKIPTFFLGCLLLVALVGFVSSLRFRARAQRIGALPVVTESAADFDSRLAAISDPAELRTLASREHQRVLAGSQLVTGMSTLLTTTLGRSLPIQAGVFLAFLLAYYLFEYRIPPR